MNALSADALLEQGRQAFRQAIAESVRADGVVEDLPVPAMLDTARQAFEDAASRFEAEGRAVDGARARTELADVFLNMRQNREVCAAAETSCRTALGVLDVAVDRDTSARAFLRLADSMMRPLYHEPAGAEKEEQLRKVISVIRAAGYIARDLGDAALRSEADELLSRALGEQFAGDRDANLLDAIRAATCALPAARDAMNVAPIRYPSLQLHIGTCYMKLDGPRSRWLEAGLAAYAEGLSAADAKRTPRLRAVLAGNADMARGLIADGNLKLPEQETMARFGAIFQSKLNARDLVGAREAAWRAMAWSWTLAPAPNMWTGEVHKWLGALSLHENNGDDALRHFYSAAAILGALAAAGDPRIAALRDGAVQMLTQTLDRLGQSQLAAGLAKQASVAAQVAYARYTRASELFENDPAAARTELDVARALMPHDPVLLYTRAQVLMKLGDAAGARDNFNEALRYLPANTSLVAARDEAKRRAEHPG